jgi:hypothetical protein
MLPDFSALNRIRRLPGTHQPWLCSDGAGHHYALKPAASQEQAAEEVLADTLYIRAGLPVPTSAVIDCDGKPARLTQWIHGTTLASAMRGGKPLPRTALADLLDGLALDIILQNEDVLGRHGDNIIIGPDDVRVKHTRAMGKTSAMASPIHGAWRIDNGSALRWSATGGPRHDFGPVPDLRWLRTDWPALIFDAGGDRRRQPSLLAHIRASLAILAPSWPAIIGHAPLSLRARLDARREWLTEHAR